MTQATEQRVPLKVVTPEPESRLEQLLASYDDAKSNYEAAKERFDSIKDSIKAELAEAAPGAEKVEVSSQYLERTLRLSHRLEWRIDSRRLKEEKPELYVKYARQIGSWRLEAKR